MSYIGKKMGTLQRLVYRFVTKSALTLKAGVMHSSAPAHKCSVAFIDDLLPHPGGAFRSSEISYLLRHIPGSMLFNTIATKFSKRRGYEYFSVFSEKDFKENRKWFSKEFDIKEERMQPFFPWSKIDTKLAYIIFLNNAYYMIDYMEEHNIKFILELYPGGGFTVLTEGHNFNMLKRVLASPSLACVFITQKLSLDFVLEHKLCDESKITFFYGGILSPKLFGQPAKTAQYPLNKDVIDICFVASKYTPRGMDKGYDIFIDMAHLIIKQKQVFRFHIVGGFDENDIPIDPAYRQYFKFYGYMKFSEFSSFYAGMDIFISPSRPFMITKGSFDGFPTSTCVEAGLCGVCMILSDPLEMNVGFVNNHDIIIVDNDPQQFADEVMRLSDDPAEIYRLGNNSKKGIEGDPPERQLGFRLDLINKYLS